MKIPEPETPEQDERQWLTEWQEYEAEIERMGEDDENDREH